MTVTVGNILLLIIAIVLVAICGQLSGIRDLVEEKSIQDLLNSSSSWSKVFRLDKKNKEEVMNALDEMFENLDDEN